MDWVEFAKKIEGEFEATPNGFISGDTILKVIKKENTDIKIKIEKIIRRSYGASSHFNVEKLNLEYSIKKLDFGKSRIIRKSLFGRIDKLVENQYNVEGDSLICQKEILSLPELKYLLCYPKSEFILLKNKIQFKSQSLGMMNEELEKIFAAINILKDNLKHK